MPTAAFKSIGQQVGRNGMITYKDQTKPDTGRARIAVILDGRTVGHIKGTFDGRFAYMPKGSRISGRSYRSVEAVKASLEAAE